MTHDLKIGPHYFDDVASSRKPFEVRKDDRRYNVGDTLRLREWRDGKYTGRETYKTITYVLRDSAYCKAEFCILGLDALRPEREGDRIVRCRDCIHQNYDAEYGRRWCDYYLSSHDVRADGSGFCDRGKAKED